VETGNDVLSFASQYERDPVAILELGCGRLDLGWLDFDFTEAAQRVGDDAGFGGRLCRVVEMLELATAADRVVGTRRIAAGWAGGNDAEESTARPLTVALDDLDLDLLARRSARNEHDRGVGLSSQAIASRDDGGDLEAYRLRPTLLALGQLRRLQPRLDHPP
jgi:hypothetical protein